MHCAQEEGILPARNNENTAALSIERKGVGLRQVECLVQLRSGCLRQRSETVGGTVLVSPLNSAKETS